VPVVVVVGCSLSSPLSPFSSAQPKTSFAEINNSGISFSLQISISISIYSCEVKRKRLCIKKIIKMRSIDSKGYVPQHDISNKLATISVGQKREGYIIT
jgi:hypothetical protein